MRLLIVNIDLRFPTGTVVATRDFAMKLRGRGHKVSVYSPRLGPPATDLAKNGVTVVDRVEDLITTPDVIHGHHNLSTILPMARFPDTPAIWINHGRGGWFDTPPPLTGIYRYLAIDNLRRDLLTKTFGIAESKVEMLPNAVDLEKFPLRSKPLPETPRQLLLFAKSGDVVPIALSAAKSFGMELDAIGIGVGRPTMTPERFLRKADIILATGRMAIESACAGAAVVVADGRGVAGMLTSANYDELRKVNFGATSLVRKLTTQSLEGELRRYDRDDAMAVSARMRADTDLVKTVERLEGLYKEAMAEGATWVDADSEFIRRTIDQWPVVNEPAPVWSKVRKELAAIAAQRGIA